MGTKENLLLLLEQHKGEYLSGEEIAQLLSLSRTAVWKAVNALREDGYEIAAVRNRGYCLAESTDILSSQGIGRYLQPLCGKLDVCVYPELPSTNALLREKANEGAPEGSVVIAGAQSRGRGRLGRSFYSPADTGIYMSLLLRPIHFSPAQAVKITTMAAVAASRAIEAVSGRQTGIKWVNDVFLDSRKVCGILTEASFDLESGRVDYIVLGVGFNVYAPSEGFPEELSGIAGAILESRRNDGKNRLAAEFLNQFMAVYGDEDGNAYAEEYRARSFVIGKRILVITPLGQREATALDVDRDCHLIVRYDDGGIEALSSAEISIRTV